MTSSKILCVNWNISTSNRARWISIFPLLKTTAPCGWRRTSASCTKKPSRTLCASPVRRPAQSGAPAQISRGNPHFFAGIGPQSGRILPRKDAQDRQAGGHFQQSELPAVSGLLSVREGPCHDHFLFRRNGADAGDCPACKRSGTPILALTSFGENSLTCYADCKLTLSTKESIYQNLGDYASHLSMTLLLDILYSEYFRQNYQKNYTYKLERARELEQHRTSTNPILLNLHKENAE